MDQFNEIACPNCGSGTKLRDAGQAKVREGKGEVTKQRLQCLTCGDVFLVEGRIRRQLLEG